MASIYDFQEIGRLAGPGDNVAIATRRLEDGTQVSFRGNLFGVDFTVLEGHRFAVTEIAAGQPLLSWGQPFGRARHRIRPGAYVCNDDTLAAVRGRSGIPALPEQANFDDWAAPFAAVPEGFQPATPLPAPDYPRTFAGYRRSGTRGVGTRNLIVLLGTTSLTAAFVQRLAQRLRSSVNLGSGIDGIVPVAHTEGAAGEPRNLDMVLRTLAGFMVHPNVGAVLAVDHGSEAVSNERLRQYMFDHEFPLADVFHQFLTLDCDLESGLAKAESIVGGWLDLVGAWSRTQMPVSHLKIALQCGGSDAFSGISGNPLAALAAREIIRQGGAANLAETDELVGAEAYVLQRVKDWETVERFLDVQGQFQERASWHGASVAGNPSGGNRLRGLYNIYLKSLGAAMKRHPDVRLEGVLEYGQGLPGSGLYFMDSPGNDIESIAGQVASGCNLIYFITGNGSITNFPFVPTLKIVTTSERYQLLLHDMDVNAGAYLEGVPLEVLSDQLLDLTLAVASGQRTRGEEAGQAQVQLWRDWQQRDGRHLAHLQATPEPTGAPLPVPSAEPPAGTAITALATTRGLAHEQVGLILPTSLCASQIARLAANQLNQVMPDRAAGISRYVALVHTEGCGVSGAAELIYRRTLLSYLRHPSVAAALLLEHGCEKTHNDYMRRHIAQMGLQPDQLGWASIQLDGGIERVMNKISRWFRAQVESMPVPVTSIVGLSGWHIALLTAGPVTDDLARQWVRLAHRLVAGGCSVILPANDHLLTVESYRRHLLGVRAAKPTLAYAQPPTQRGLHLMETPTTDWTEVVTGLAACGTHLIMAHVGDHPRQGNPLVPLLQVTTRAAVAERYQANLDWQADTAPDAWPVRWLSLIADTLNGQHPRLAQLNLTGFQVTRGLLGISL